MISKDSHTLLKATITVELLIGLLGLTSAIGAFVSLLVCPPPRSLLTSQHNPDKIRRSICARHWIPGRQLAARKNRAKQKPSPARRCRRKCSLLDNPYSCAYTPK